MLTILFDGVAYGMLLFILAVGLAVTMGLMNFINLAHGAFAMAGGYLTVVLMQRFDVPFLVCLPVSFVVTGAVGAFLEKTLYRRMYQKPHLDQVLFSIGLAFMSVSSIDYFMGSQQQIIQLPEWLRGRTELLGDFHVRIAELMGNPVLAQILGELISRCALITLMYQSQNAAQHSAEEHDEIVDAMAQKNADLAAQLMESHLNFVEQSLSFNKKIPTYDIALALS